MAKIRKRTWKSGGKNGREPKEKTAWIADYFDRGKRHIKTFPTRKEAEVDLLRLTRDKPTTSMGWRPR